MASAFTHAFFATVLGTVMTPGQRRLTLLGALAAVLPDTDVVGFALGIPYAHMLGHRGLSHSIPLAAGVAVALAWAISRERSSTEGASPPSPARAARNAGDPSTARIASYLFVAIASHGALDALTNGGLGVAFFAPFSSRRFFFPWRPIAVSPISVTRFFSDRGLEILASEASVVWLPSLAVAFVIFAWRRSRRRLGA